MKVRHENGTEIDTDKLSDVAAYATEQCAEIAKMFGQFKIPFLLIVPLSADKVVLSYNYPDPKADATKLIVSMQKVVSLWIQKPVEFVVKETGKPIIGEQ